MVFLADGRLAGGLSAPTADAVAERLAHLGDLVIERPGDQIGAVA